MTEALKPLDGITIIDLTRLVPGPFTSMLLSDLGARVIKVESPSAPDILRFPEPHLDGANVGFSTLNRSKESLVVELTRPDGAEVVARLAEKADVLLTSTRPGWLEGRGLGHQQLSQKNPGLISCALRGYSESSQEGHKGGHDINFLALSGLAACLRGQGGQPILPSVQLGDIAGGLSAAVAILAALVERGKSGAGRSLEISLTQSCSAFTVLLEAAALLGVQQKVFELGALTGKSPAYRYYQCADGRWLAVGALEKKYQQRLLERLELHAPEGLWPVSTEDWPTDLFMGWEEAGAATEVLEKVFRSKSRDQWVELFVDLDACITPVLEVPEAIESSGAVYQSLDSEQNLVPQPAGLLDSGFPGDSLRRTAALPGQHTKALLLEAGYSESEIAVLIAEGVALVGP